MAVARGAPLPGTTPVIQALSAPLLLLLLPLLLIQAVTALDRATYNLNGTSAGDFWSVNFPDDYNNGLADFYFISVDPGNYIRLSFDEFDTEGCCDKLYIFDGQDFTKQPAVTLSGNHTGFVWMSTSNGIAMMFETDIETTRPGFYAHYESVLDGTHFLPSNLCPRSFYMTGFGFLTSPNYPLNYPDGIVCGYTVYQKGGRVELTFTDLQTEGCCDTVEVFDGSDVSATRLARLTGTALPSPNNLTSSGEYLFVKFTSDYTENYKGFAAAFRKLGPLDSVMRIL